jgi:hypothetical protein
MDLSIRGIAIDPQAPSKGYVATQIGVVTSSDGGVNWTLLYLPFSSVLSMAVDPSQPDTVYAGLVSTGGLQSGLFRSKPEGSVLAFQSVGSGMRNVSVLSVAISPSGVVYAGQETSIRRTDNGGQSWKSVHGGTSLIFAIVIDPSQPSTIYAGKNGQGVARSTDGGDSWVLRNDGLPGVAPVVQGFAIDPAVPDVVYAATPNGVFKTTDGAGSWKPASTGLTSANTFAVAVDPSRLSTVYAATAGGVFKSSNAGTSWSTASKGLPAGNVWAIAVDPRSPATLFAGTSVGPYRSTDAGASWTASNSGIASPTLSLVFDRAKSVLYAGTRSGVFQTSNGGGTWTSVGSGLINPSVNALVLGPAEALYAATDGAGVFRLDSPSPDRQLVDGSPERPPTRTVGPRF